MTVVPLSASRVSIALSLLACSLAMLCILGSQHARLSGRVSLARLDAESEMAKLEADVASAGKLLDREARRSSRQTSGAEPIEADTEVGNEDAKLREIRGRIDRDKSQEASDAREMEKAELVASRLKAKILDERSQRQADMDDLSAEMRRAQKLVRGAHERSAGATRAGGRRADGEMEMVASVARMESETMKLLWRAMSKRHGSMLLGEVEGSASSHHHTESSSVHHSEHHEYESEQHEYHQDPNHIARQRPSYDNPPPACTTKPDPGECERWKKNIEREIAEYERDLRGSSDYSYGKEERDRRSGVEPNIHNIVPQRYPHKDGADLGDNWISGFDQQHKEGTGDRFRPSWDSRSDHPSGADAFLGQANRDRTDPLYSRDARLSEQDKQRLKDRQLLQFAHSEYGSGRTSPLDPRLLQMMWGDVEGYMQDSYGYPTDSFPSTRQMKKQLMRTATKDVLEARYDRKKGFPRKTPVVERCRRTCSRCPFKEVLERRQTACKKPDCRQGRCSKSDDPLTKQIAKGSLNGKADPFGFQGELEDDEIPEQMVAKQHNPIDPYTHYGEPVTDAIIRGWDMHNGVDFSNVD